MENIKTDVKCNTKSITKSKANQRTMIVLKNIYFGSIKQKSLYKHPFMHKHKMRMKCTHNGLETDGATTQNNTNIPQIIKTGKGSTAFVNNKLQNKMKTTHKMNVEMINLPIT